MQAPETEIVDSLIVEQHSGSVSGSTYVGLTSTKKIRGMVLQCPNVGPFKNNWGEYLRFSLDGRQSWFTLGVGGVVGMEGNPSGNTVWLMSSAVSGVGYEASLHVEGAY